MPVRRYLPQLFLLVIPSGYSSLSAIPFPLAIPSPPVIPSRGIPPGYSPQLFLPPSNSLPPGYPLPQPFPIIPLWIATWGPAAYNILIILDKHVLFVALPEIATAKMWNKIE